MKKRISELVINVDRISYHSDDLVASKHLRRSVLEGTVLELVDLGNALWQVRVFGGLLTPQFFDFEYELAATDTCIVDDGLRLTSRVQPAIASAGRFKGVSVD